MDTNKDKNECMGGLTGHRDRKGDDNKKGILCFDIFFLPGLQPAKKKQTDRKMNSRATFLRSYSGTHAER